MNDTDLLDALNVAAFPDGLAVNLAAIFGNSISYDEDGNMMAAAVSQVRAKLVYEFLTYTRHPAPPSEEVIRDDAGVLRDVACVVRNRVPL